MPSPEVSPSLLTVIIPTLNAAGSLPHTLATLEEAGAAVEVIVVDGGSTDNTRTLAPRCIVAPRGRGAQLAAGAAAAEKATWLLFLHADTRLAPGWWAEARAHMETHSETAATFRFALDALAPQARRIERLVAWRCRWLGPALRRPGTFDPTRPLRRDRRLPVRFHSWRMWTWCAVWAGVGCGS